MRPAFARSVAGVVVLFVSLAGSARAAAPEFQQGALEDVFARPGEPFSFEVRAIDLDTGDEVTLTAQNLPPGADFEAEAGNPAIGTFTWTPAQACGDWAVTFYATDSSSEEATWTTAVHVLYAGGPFCIDSVFPLAGTTAGGTQVTVFGMGFRGDVSASIDGAEVVGLVRQGPTKILFDTPPGTSGPPSTLTVTSAGTASTTFFYVTPPSTPPVFAPVASDYFVVEGQNFSIPVSASDPDAGDSVSLGASNLPASASWAAASGNPASSTFSWIPPTGSHGDYLVQFHATDETDFTTTSVIEIHVLSPGAVPTRVVAVIPNEGPNGGGTHVVLRGEGLPTAGSPTVTVGGNSVLGLLFVNSTQLEFDTPHRGPNASDVAVVVNTAGLWDGFYYFADPPDAPTVSIEDVSGANATDVALGIDGEAGADAEWTISDEDPVTADVTGSDTIGADGTLDASLDLSSLSDGDLTVSVTQTNAGGTSPAAETTAVKDTAPPVLSLPADITLVASSTSGQAVSYGASATDARDGAVAITCTPASGTVFEVGTTTVDCSAEDALGNVANGSFTVSLTWSWSGPLAPIVDGGTYKLGRVLPLRFLLTGASSGVTDVVATVTLSKVSSGVPGEPIDAQAPGEANTGNQFRYDAATGQYTFNLATKGLTAGTWLVEISLGDDVTRSFTIALAP